MLHSAHQGGVCIVNNAQFSRPSSLLHRVMLAGCAAVLVSSSPAARADALADVRASIDRGQFAAADSQIAAALRTSKLSAANRDAQAARTLIAKTASIQCCRCVTIIFVLPSLRRIVSSS